MNKADFIDYLSNLGDGRAGNPHSLTENPLANAIRTQQESDVAVSVWPDGIILNPLSNNEDKKIKLHPWQRKFLSEMQKVSGDSISGQEALKLIDKKPEKDYNWWNMSRVVEY